MGHRPFQILLRPLAWVVYRHNLYTYCLVEGWSPYSGIPRQSRQFYIPSPPWIKCHHQRGTNNGFIPYLLLTSLGVSYFLIVFERAVILSLHSQVILQRFSNKQKGVITPKPIGPTNKHWGVGGSVYKNIAHVETRFYGEGMMLVYFSGTKF